MDVQLNMLGASMMHKVLAHVDDEDIVAVGDRGAWDIDVELAEKLPEPNTLGHRVRHGPVLGFGA